MATEKRNKVLLEKLQRQKGFIQRQLDDCRVLSEGVDTPFWRKIKQVVAAKKLKVEEQLRDFRKKTSEERAILLTEQEVLDYFFSLPDDFAKSEQMFHERLANVNQRISELRNER